MLTVFSGPWVATRPLPPTRVKSTGPQKAPANLPLIFLIPLLSPHPRAKSTPSAGRALSLRFPPDLPRYLFYLNSSGSRSHMSEGHARPSSRDQRDPQVGVLRSRSSSRDMSWRKPVPKFIPSPPISPGLGQSFGQCQQYTASPTATTFGYTVDRANPFSMSLTSLNHQLPPVRGGATLVPCFRYFLVECSC